MAFDRRIDVPLPGDGWEAHAIQTAGYGWGGLILKPSVVSDHMTEVFKAYGFDGPDAAEGAVRDAAARMCAWYSIHGGRIVSDLTREQHATINEFICQTLMPEWEADGWWYEHDDDPPTVPGIERGFLLERDGTRVLVTVALVESAPKQPTGDAS